MKLKITALLALITLSFSCDKLEDNKTETSPKNIILMISDGCGLNHILTTNYYIDGTGVSQPYQKFDVSLFMSTYPAINSNIKEADKLSVYNTGYISESALSDFEYVNKGYTGSAASATGIYTGKKAAQHAIGVDLESNPLRNIADRAYELGKSLGVVTSVPLSHATPAALVAHNSNRYNYAEIANEMIIDSKLSVIMGCGHPYYNKNAERSDTLISEKYLGGLGTWENLKKGATFFDSATISGNHTVQDIDGDSTADPWVMINDSIDFVNMASGKTPKRVIGVANVYETLQEDRHLDKRKDGTLAFEIPFNRNIPTLEDMSKAALNVLDNNKNGFLVMIEGGAIDWAGHANEIERIIEEENDFNNSVKAVIQWIDNNSSWDETLLIVTADHETGYLVGPDYPGEDLMANHAVKNNGKGKLPSHTFLSHKHTNQLVPFYAKGIGSKKFERMADETDYFRGPYLNNTEIGQSIFFLWDSYQGSHPDTDPAAIKE